MRWTWRLSLLTLAFALLCGFTTPGWTQEKISVDGASVGDAMWVVKAKVDGRPASFLVATENRGSILSSEFLGLASNGKHEGTHSVSIAGHDFNNVTFAVEQFGKDNLLNGVLGSDLLSKLSIGFDLNTGEVFVWDKDVAEGAAKRWVQQSPLIQDSQASACTMSFDQFSANRVVFPCGKPELGMRGILCTYTHGSRMQPELADKLNWIKLRNTDVPYRFEPRKTAGSYGVVLALGMGGATSMPLYGICVDDPESPWFRQDKVAVQLAVDDLPTRRLVINYKKRFLCFEQLSADGQCSWLATRWTGWPLAVKNEALCIDPSYGPRMSPARDARVPWAKIRTIGDISAEDILAVLRNPTVQGIAKLSPILDPQHPSRAKLSTEEANYDMGYTK